MDVEKILRRLCKCAVCERSLKNSRYINLVALNKKPPGAFPVMRNIEKKGDPDHAVAALCDSCLEKNDVSKVKFALEFSPAPGAAKRPGVEQWLITYHDVDKLPDL